MSPVPNEADMIIVLSIIPTIINNVCPGRLGMFLNANFNIMRLLKPITKTMDIATTNPIKSVLDIVSVDRPNMSVINTTHSCNSVGIMLKLFRHHPL